MLFNRLEFALFFIIVYGLYLVLNHKWQNRMLLVASYIFYGSWDWRFLSLIFISTVLDYFCGIKVDQAQNRKRKKLFLFFSVFGNLTILGFFKYFNFFAENFQSLLNHFGFFVQPHFLSIILPIGISFYTFQTMSYTLDIYRGKIKPTHQFLDLALFVAFFPQLVAGPIERARNLLPQILSPRKVNLDKFYEGSYLIFQGLFKKIFVADNLARLVDPVFSGNGAGNGLMVLLSLYAFAFQIYCDFSGYSDIARGLGKCMGFDIMINFRLPYFATNPRDFWRRWHISLSSWLKDYLYIPLGGNRKGKINTYRNLIITMLLGGLWHGAAWTFIIWGAYHGFLLVVHRLMEPFIKGIFLPKSRFAKRLWHIVRIIFFFHLVCFSWLFFRATSMGQAMSMLKVLFGNFYIAPACIGNLLKFIFFVCVLFTIQVFQFLKNDFLVIRRINISLRAATYFLMIYLIITYGVFVGREFIYFQF